MWNLFGHKPKILIGLTDALAIELLRAQLKAGLGEVTFAPLKLWSRKRMLGQNTEHGGTEFERVIKIEAHASGNGVPKPRGVSAALTFIRWDDVTDVNWRLEGFEFTVDGTRQIMNRRQIQEMQDDIEKKLPHLVAAD